jgi:predicted RNA-binding protein with PUA-like domain
MRKHLMQYWLMKSAPDEFSISDLAKVKVSPWDGIRNYQARNMMRDQISTTPTATRSASSVS